MAIHPRLEEFTGVEHLKVFSKVLKQVEKELTRAGCDTYTVDIEATLPKRSALRRFFAEDLKNAYQQMSVEATAHGCEFRLLLPMLEAGFLDPSMLTVELPVSAGVSGSCHRRAVGRKWELEPPNKTLAKELRRLLPKVRMEHPLPGGAKIINVCYALEPGNGDSTLWFVHAGYAPKVIGPPAPEVAKYLDAIPALIDVLKSQAGR